MAPWSSHCRLASSTASSSNQSSPGTAAHRTPGRRAGGGQSKSCGSPPMSRHPTSRRPDLKYARMCGRRCSPESRRPPRLPMNLAEPRDRYPQRLAGNAAVLLALPLCAQLIHGNRAWIATHAPLRGPLHGSIRGSVSQCQCAGEPLLVSVAPMGRHRRSERERDAARARQHSQHGARNCSPIRCCASRWPTALARRSARAISSPQNTWASRPCACCRRESGPMRR